MSLEDRSSRRIIMKGRKSKRVVEKRIGEEGRRSGEKCQKKRYAEDPPSSPEEFVAILFGSIRIESLKSCHQKVPRGSERLVIASSV